MSDAPERIWIDPEYLDSPRVALLCNLGTSDPARALSSDVAYTRTDAAEADTRRAVGEEREWAWLWAGGRAGRSGRRRRQNSCGNLLGELVRRSLLHAFHPED